MEGIRKGSSHHVLTSWKPSSGVSKGRRTKCDMEARDSATKPGAGKVLDCPGKRISPFRFSDGKDTRVGLENEENRNFPRATWLAGLQDLRAAERQHQHQEERVQKVHAELVTERSCTEEQVKGRVWWSGLS